MGVASKELTRSSNAYLVCLVFALTFLITTLFGGSPLAAVIRGSVVALLAYITLPFLIYPVVSVVLDAMARDQMQEQKPQAKEEAR
ncbi:MAG: hypothetical protein ACYTG5_16265 [Planctomycetota bacterium]|jgi:hypothetical protein